MSLKQRTIFCKENRECPACVEGVWRERTSGNIERRAKTRWVRPTLAFLSSSLVLHIVFFLAGLHSEKGRGWTTQTVCHKLPAANVRQNRRRGRYHHPPRGEGIYYAWGWCYLHYKAYVRHCYWARSQVYSSRREQDCGDWCGDKDYRVKGLPTPLCCIKISSHVALKFDWFVACREKMLQLST